MQSATAGCNAFEAAMVTHPVISNVYDLFKQPVTVTCESRSRTEYQTLSPRWHYTVLSDSRCQRLSHTCTSPSFVVNPFVAQALQLDPGLQLVGQGTVQFNRQTVSNTDGLPAAG